MRIKNTLTPIGSDIDDCIETKIDVEVIEEGSIVIDSRIFGEIIRKLPNAEVEVTSIDENTIGVKL